MKNNVVLDFVHAINTADLEKLLDLMTEDHVFIDSQGATMTGKDKLKQAWKGYFELFPDYNIEITTVLENESLICLLGYTGGTYKNLKNADNSNYWRMPCCLGRDY